MTSGFQSLFLLAAGILFVLALRGLSSASTSKRGNTLGMIGMIIAIITSIHQAENTLTILAILAGGIIGYCITYKINMTNLPQLVAAFHSLVGLAAVFISCSIFMSAELIFNSSAIPIANAFEMSLGVAIGAITFSGSLIAFGKLQGFINSKVSVLKKQQQFNLFLAICIIASIIWFIYNQSSILFAAIILSSFIMGYSLIMPIGGADMPVIVSMLNSYSGWAAAGIGFTLQNNLLIIVGALVGASGAILSSIMCKGMNRSLLKVIIGGTGSDTVFSNIETNPKPVKLCNPEDASFIMQNAKSIIIIPGYGMAVAQAQHVIKELSDILKTKGISVKYAIHPVAGRMPGHMNVLLAEANIAYEDVFEIDEINHEFGATDVAIVIGANDITNPSAKTDPTSSIYGMPILDAEKARTVLFIKRSLGSGYAGVDNPLFYQNNTMMILGDAKKVCEEILKSLRTFK